MIFSEVYGNYFNAVADILRKATDGKLTGKELTESVQSKAFGESILTIPASLKDGTWPLLRDDFSTPLKKTPEMPLTTLQKQWLKALLLDPRVRLFNPSEEGLEDVEPLFTPDMFVYFDRYGDGDPFEDENYIRNFRTILRAIKEKKKITVSYLNRKQHRQRLICSPQRIEYSSKDDKFRVLISETGGSARAMNVARIQSVKILDETSANPGSSFGYRMKTLVFELTNERNGLDRAMLHFSDLQKETEKTGFRKYRITLHYEQEDETEILIRLLSFGPIIRVIEPESMKTQIRERLIKQAELRK